MEETLIHVEGSVQGVGYRAFAQREAVALGLTGFARNLPDGRVEVLAQGDEAAVELFIDRLREGPRLAAVRDVAAIKKPSGMAYGSFKVE